MAETGAAAAAPAPPAEGKVIPIHSLDEWSMQIDEANSTDTKKLVFLDFFLIAPFLFVVARQRSAG
jgi:thioredoxin 1